MSGYPARRIGDRVHREIVLCQMFMCLFWPLEVNERFKCLSAFYASLYPFFCPLPPGPSQPVHSAPVFTIAMLKKSFQPFSKASKTWGILVDTGAATSVAPKGFAPHIVLSPAPPTLQLTTATGKAIETYGLRRVHLHNQGLSFEVACVIADVVTPLLGLDSMLHESLSLHVGQNSKHYSVAPGGERAQLEHKGKHLCLIACPSKLGSSNFIMSNLSKVSWLSTFRQAA